VGELEDARLAMVRAQLETRDIRDPRVLEAMRRVPRHAFVPQALRGFAYDDGPLPIGHGQTISQPYIVALMTQLALGDHPQRVLDVGTGCGYQAAVLAELFPEVHSVEIVPELAEQARARLAQLGYARVHVHGGDGRVGWPEAAPYDAIVAACAALEVPDALIEQLAVGGRLVIPVGRSEQQLVRIRKTPEGISREVLFGVRFVPMRGEAEKE
jgi:protein-L-isoaspartate(D-aspartate) O-methyltransferase